jgi:hypothetical protein
VLVVARVGQHGSFTFLPTGMVYSEQLVVIAIPSNSAFCTLQSRIHEIWARFFGSSMKDDLRYTPSDCFETFPFPENWETNPTLEAVGKEYEEYRAELMVRNNQGLTDTYNRFHDPDERDPNILKLRELHTKMDRAVLDAYGWHNISTQYDFLLDYEEEPGENTSRSEFESKRNIITEILEQSTADLSNEAKICAKKLLKELFPRLVEVELSNRDWSDWEQTWTKKKHIASTRYFKRYFAYGIPEDDISDESLAVFFNQLNIENASNISNEIVKITRDASCIDTFITESYRKLDGLSSSASFKLALALAKMGDYFSKSDTLYSLDTPFIKTGILISHLIEKFDASDNKVKLSKQIIQTANPVYFAIECFKWIYASTQDDEQEDSFDLSSKPKTITFAKENLFSESEIRNLAEVVINRIEDITKEKVIYNEYPERAREIITFWACWSSKEKTNNYLKIVFDKSPHSSVDFLKCYIPTALSTLMRTFYPTSLPLKNNLDKDTYNQITSVVDPELLIKHLRKIYGEKLDSPTFDRQNENQSLEELAACQFVYIHNKILADPTN